MNRLLLSAIIFTTSLHASSRSKLVGDLARAVCKEQSIYGDILKTRSSLDKKRAELAGLKGFIALYKGKSDLEEHEYLKKFNARGKALRLQSELDREAYVLRWLKMQNLGLAFASTKNILNRLYGSQVVAEYDAARVLEYSKLHEGLHAKKAA